MRIHVLRHVAFEGPGSIQAWAESRGAQLATACLYERPLLPSVGDFDWLIVMGGPMSVNDDHAYAWLAPEKKLIADAVAAGRVVLGICLGAQLVAGALGARVYAHRQKEIGWFPLEAPPRARASATGVAAAVLRAVPDGAAAFQWHGDTFDLPPGAAHLLRTAACEHQDAHRLAAAVGLQFHLEMTHPGAAALVENCGEEIKAGPTIQTVAEMLADSGRFSAGNLMMGEILDSLPRV